MADTQDFKHARVELALKKRSRDKWIGISRTRHGAWVAARRSNDHKKTDAAFKSWKQSVQTLHTISQRIGALEKYLDKGATAASLDLAKAVAVWEGGRSKDGKFHPYQDAVRVWTIGYGHTAADGAPVPGPNTRPLSAEEAALLLLHDLNTFYVPAVAAALKAYGWKVNQKMFDALVSFAYNLGAGYFGRGHDMGDAMSTRSARLTAHAMLLYDRAGGAVLVGLLRRRTWEGKLFMGGTYVVTN